ncbi:MAG: hypothetical protein GXO86_10375 [Chlorobi bacterium]|nr:hypothetical protein [Chlorobiota bacterium]
MTDERWYHITTGHPEMAAYYDDILETVEEPEIVYLGSNDEHIAIKRLNDEISKYIVVVYKELNENDGFIITSFITNKMLYFVKKKIIWKR